MLALLLMMGGGAAVAWDGILDRQQAQQLQTLERAEIEAMTAAELRRSRGGTDGLQDPVATSPATSSSAKPVRLVIPEIGVDSDLEGLHRDARGVLVAPAYADEAGWWAKGVVPGQIGAAVIVGHLDTVQGPAVFVHLQRLRPGDLIEVTMSDGSTVRFTVDGSHVVDKALFPSDDVYGATPDSQLRLITCSEPFDPVAHSYTDNLVVFATMKS